MVTEHHVWNTQFVFVTLIFLLVYRALGEFLKPVLTFSSVYRGEIGQAV